MVVLHVTKILVASTPHTHHISKAFGWREEVRGRHLGPWEQDRWSPHCEWRTRFPRAAGGGERRVSRYGRFHPWYPIDRKFGGSHKAGMSKPLERPCRSQLKDLKTGSKILKITSTIYYRGDHNAARESHAFRARHGCGSRKLPVKITFR